MSRHRSSGAYGFAVRLIGEALPLVELSWQVDRYYPGSRQRFPRRGRRRTEDPAAALAFCRRHGLDVPSWLSDLAARISPED